MRGPFVPYAPEWDGVVAVTVDSKPKCTAVFIATHLALSIASCFLQPLPLSEASQASCMLGPCEGAMVVPERVRLISGPDARIGAVAARVKRIAVRFTVPWAIPACTPSLCGEGWDIALLELDPSCDHGPLPCLPPLSVATAPAMIGLAPAAIAYGANPDFDRRSEWDLSLPSNGTGVRRSVDVRIRHVASMQRLTVELGGTGDSSEGAKPFCVGDEGAVLISSRDGAWQVDGLGVPTGPRVLGSDESNQLPASATCYNAGGSVWSVHASRCWIEASVRKWGLPPVNAQHSVDCNGLDLMPPEIDGARIGSGGFAGEKTARTEYLMSLGGDDGSMGAATGSPAALALNCSVTPCEFGLCVGERCECEEEFHGPRCSVRGPPPVPLPPVLRAIAVSPGGADSAACGSESTPCRTLRHALERQFWQAHAGGGYADVVLHDGTYTGDDNRGLVLHGIRVHVRSARGPATTQIDCRRELDQMSGFLFVRGASPLAMVSGLTLRKCQATEQISQALSPQPRYATHFTGAAGWPSGRQGIVYRQNRWLAT